MKKHEKYPKLFEPFTVKRMTVKNRISMAPMGTNYGEQNGEMSFLHMDYYEQRAQGGVGLIIVENACVDFPLGSNGTTQIRIDHDNYIPRLYKLCESVHQYGTCIAIQINHAGASALESRIGMQTVSSSDVPSKPGGCIPRPLTKEEIEGIVKKYGEAAKRAQTAGFDAVEIHAGHGYLISQFLSPYTNHRKDEYGGSLENRMRFMEMVMNEVMTAAGSDMAVFVKMNMRDGFKGGMETDETLQVAKRLLALGAHALVLSGGFVSKAPMYVMRGAMPIRSMAYYMDCWWLKYGVRMFGKWMIPTVPFREAYFLEDALKFRAALPEAPLIYVGGLVSREKIDEVLDAGFDAVQMARALLNEPEFVNRMRREEQARCNCGHSNYCIGRMYTIEMACHQHLKEKLPPCLQREIEKLEKQ